MALKTLKKLKVIGGFPVVREEDFAFAAVKAIEGPSTAKQFNKWVNKHPIVISHIENSIKFKLQDGPIKEAGVNGCQVDTIIETALIMLQGLNEQYPCYENQMAINKLVMALKWMDERKKDRETRGVEGTSNA